MKKNIAKFQCVLHGSFTKHFDLIKKTRKVFTEAGIEVLAPKQEEVVTIENGFALFNGEENKDPRLIELIYLQNLKKLGKNGFSYFINPEGYIGKSVSYELGIAQLTNTRCFFLEEINDHPAYLHKNSIWEPQKLAEFILEHKKLPNPAMDKNEEKIHQLWEDLMVPGSVVATGGIIEYQPNKKKYKEVLLVKTHKWGGRYSIVGGKVRRNERLNEALLREVREETGLSGKIGKHLATFDQIKNSGYYLSGIQHIFVDNVVHVGSKKVKLNEEAQDHIWMPAKEALRDLPIEPNARHTLELYLNSAN
ncbi:MAG: NUDIX domain-containing protein [Candidatus Spechtbacterales bacterium]|nr:NUDIX domain-containing protein [Candidatus Spechtbacterales bacterium]